ncbi:MAG: hypothetical protein NTW93_06470 [Phycisphaerae bacterium]|nr:hypothetical protein [Phycisphaerae bacterium]
MYHADKKAMIKIALLFVLFMPSVLYSDVLLEADGPNGIDTYELIESKGYGYEVPDCNHPVEHISEIWDSELNKNVFVFSIHKDLDNDRCLYFDRQRNEIKTYGPSGASMYATNGETHIYTWKFKLDSAFQASTSFTHIHQIKASGPTGSDVDMPIITLTPRKASTNKLQLLYCPGGTDQTQTEVASANLSLFQGVWVEVYERYLSTDTGTYEIVIRRVSDGAILLSWSNNNIDMWRTGADFNRPKYGIYRSLNVPTDLRDEDVRFADFYLSESLLLNPRGLAATAGNETVSLTWDNNLEINLAGYNVYRSTTPDSGYSKLNTSLLGTQTHYTDNNGVTNDIPYYYIVTAVDTSSNESEDSNIVSATPSSSSPNTYFYDFAGITQSDTNYNAYACDVDIFPFAGDPANRNTMVEANNTEYVNISANDTAEWAPINPGSSDQTLLWVEMKINESSSNINKIDLTFNGNTGGTSNTTYRIYVKKAAPDANWTQSASWVQVGSDQSILPNADTTMTRSITSNIGDYIDGTGKIVWAVYETTSNQVSHNNYLEMAVTGKTCQDVQDANHGLLSDLNGDCYVDFRDVDIIAYYWLHTDCTVLNNYCEGADFIPTDGTVNFVDFSDFAVDWMRCNNPQDSNCTPNW